MYFDCDQHVTPFYIHFILKVITWAHFKRPKIEVCEYIYIPQKSYPKGLHKVIS
jgi:hypothetical protein